MFLAENLDIDVLVVVLVQCRNRARIADPQIGGVRIVLEGYSREGNVSWDISGERQILMPEVVVFC